MTKEATYVALELDYMVAAMNRQALAGMYPGQGFGQVNLVSNFLTLLARIYRPTSSTTTN